MSVKSFVRGNSLISNVTPLKLSWRVMYIPRSWKEGIKWMNFNERETRKLQAVILNTVVHNGYICKTCQKMSNSSGCAWGSSKIHQTDTLDLICAEYKTNINNKYYTTHSFGSLPTFISMATISMAPTPLQANRLLLYLFTTRYGSNFSLA